MYECKKREFYIDEYNDNDYSEDTLKILKTFFEQEKVEMFTLI